MQFHDVHGASGLVQTINVLGYHRERLPGKPGFGVRNRAMRVVRLNRGNGLAHLPKKVPDRLRIPGQVRRT